MKVLKGTHLFLKVFFIRNEWLDSKIFCKHLALGFSVVCVSIWSVHVWKVGFCRWSSLFSGINVSILFDVCRSSLSSGGVWLW